MGKDNNVNLGMDKFLDKINKHASWIIVAFGIGAKFILNAMTMELDLNVMIRDYMLWVDIIFTVVLNLIVVSNAIDKSVIDGLLSVEFKTADAKNNIIIEDVRNNLPEFINFIKKWNANELRITQEVFLANKGVAHYDDLNEEAKIEFERLKPNWYNIEGYTMPLYAKNIKGKEYTFNATFNEATYKKRGYLAKTFFGLLSGAMTFGGVFRLNNISNAIAQTLILIFTLLISYFNYYRHPRKEFLFILPQEVNQKESVYKSFKKYQLGQIELKEEIKAQDNENKLNDY